MIISELYLHIGKVETVQTASFTIGENKTADIPTYVDENGNSSHDGYYISQEKGYAIGLDDAANKTFNPQQIVFTLWINTDNADLPVEPNIYVDGVPYIRDGERLREIGGQLLIERSDRNVGEDISETQRGNHVGILEEAGMIIDLNMGGALSAGEHEVKLILHVGEDTVEMTPFKVQIDPAAGTDPNVVETIRSEWKKHMPRKETESETETKEP